MSCLVPVNTITKEEAGEVYKMCSNFPDQKRLAKREPTTIFEFSPSNETVMCMIHSKESKTNVHTSNPQYW